MHSQITSSALHDRHDHVPITPTRAQLDPGRPTSVLGEPARGVADRSRRPKETRAPLTGLLSYLLSKENLPLGRSPRGT